MHALLVSLVVAIPPDAAYEPKLKAAETALQKACSSKTQLLVDWASFDAESVPNTFAVALSCIDYARAIADVCRDAPLRDLTEVRCALDAKQEAAMRELVKKNPTWKRSATTPPPQGAPTAQLTLDGGKLLVAYNLESGSTRVPETVRAALTAARRKDAPPAKSRLVDAADSRAGDDLVKKKLDEANLACGTKLTARLDWASLKIPDDDKTPASYAERFAAACWSAAEAIGSACEDAAVKGRLQKRLRAVECRFGQAGLALDAGRFVVTSDWESAPTTTQDLRLFLEKKL